MIAELRDDNQQVVDRLKKMKELAEQAGDNATDGLLDDWTEHGRRARVVPLPIPGWREPCPPHSFQSGAVPMPGAALLLCHRAMKGITMI